VRAAFHAPARPWTHGCGGVIHNNPDSGRHGLSGVNEFKKQQQQQKEELK